MRPPAECCIVLTAVIALACASTRTAPSPHLAATPPDTGWPVLPPLPVLSSDSTFTVESPTYPRSQLLYYRNIVGVVFDDTTSGMRIRNLLARYHATVIGGAAGMAEAIYILQVPDPGTSKEALETFLRRLEREPGINRVQPISYRTPSSIYSVQENDGQRSEWPLLTNTYPNLDTTRTVRLQGDTFQLFKTVITLHFKNGVSDATKRAFFVRHSMTVIGATQSGQFFVQMPDPGPRAQDLFDALEHLGKEPEIGIAASIPRSSLRHWDEPSSRIAWVSGRLWDTLHHMPVAKATVDIVGTTLTARADSSGLFTISGALAAGCHRLHARFIGYGWTEVRFKTTAGDSTDLGVVPMRFAPLPEWPLLLVAGCDAGPIPKEEAPWGVDTLKAN